MKFKKLVSMLTAAALAVSGLSALSATYSEEDKSKRDVYVRANDTESGNSTTIYMGDDANVYLAIDDPNKGDYDETGETEIDKHTEPQYDLNGYIVKFYYDPSYFDLADSGTNYDLNYSVAATNFTSSDEDVDPDNLDDFDIQDANYYVDSGSKGGTSTETINGKTYGVVYITVLFSDSWLPQEVGDDDDTVWYNICALPLTPKKTGTTEVFIETNSTQENYSLELLAKNVTDYPVNFDFTVVNNGYHTINIKNKQRPDPPVASPGTADYEESVDVTLSTDEEDCAIYYSIDGGTTWIHYTTDAEQEGAETPLTFTTTTTLLCKNIRSDGAESNVQTYTYTIVPSAPRLFLSDDPTVASPPATGTSSMAEYYTSTNPYYVYVSDNSAYTEISADCEIYYTYSLSASSEDMTIGTDPETEWVKVNKQYPYLYIDETRTVRLITVKGDTSGDTTSYVTTYYLGVKPAPALATPEDNSAGTSKVDVTLESETTGATIYYTLDGSDPRTSGMIYTGEITISSTTTLKTVAKYNGVYSDVMTYLYVIEPVPDDQITAYPPSGTYTDEVDVVLSSPTDRDIYYTTDGSDPSDPDNPNRILYVPGTSIPITEDTTIRAVTVDDSGNYGEEYQFEYVITPSAPILSPESEQFTASGEVTIYNPSPDKDYIVYYTTDGSDPTDPDNENRIAITDGSAVVSITTYTVINAVTYNPDNDTYSEVVTETYDIIGSRPAKPVITPEPGVYIVENGTSNTYTAEFLPVADGVTIYYTVAYASDGDYPQPDPNDGYDTTLTYTAGDEIPLKGETIIKAVAENAFGVRSDMGVYYYTITPDAPDAPPCAVLSGDLAPLRIVAVAGSTVTYTIGESNAGFTNTLTAPDDGVFYIDPTTGNAYADEAMTEMLGTENTTYDMPTDEIYLTVSAELDGVSSTETLRKYTISADGDIAPPYADKDSGEYEEYAIDSDNNLLEVNLYCLSADATIQYKTADEDTWTDYSADSPILLSDDTILNIRAEKDGEYSSIVTYVYTFVPPAPVITPASGRYSGSLTGDDGVVISVPDGVPTNRSYTIYYRRDDDTQDYRYTGQEIDITEDTSIRAYIVENDQTDNAKYSESTTAYYIIDTTAANGKVSVASPWNVRSVYLISEIVETPYSNGITLVSSNSSATIRYYYEYTRSDGVTVVSDTLTWDGTPIMVTSAMRYLKITAWLENENGAEYDGSRDTFEYTFISQDDLGAPVVDVEEGEVESGTVVKLINEYEDEPGIYIYYTLDGSDPTDPDNPSRILYQGEEIPITEDTVIRAAYVISCGECEECLNGNPDGCTGNSIYPIYGNIGKYTYTVATDATPAPTKKASSGGGGGGGGSSTKATATPSPTETPVPSDTSSSATEPPVHEHYINGYEDGTVRAENQITREEVSQITFNITEDDDKTDYTPDGEDYPDVAEDRWSAQAIEYLSDDGSVEGYPDGEFKPENKMTRAEFCALIARYLELDESDTELPFDDMNVGHWGQGYVAALYDAGYIDGYEDGTFRPDGELTRAEAVKIFNQILERTPLLEYLLTTDYNPFPDLEEDKWYYHEVLEASIDHGFDLNEDGYEEPWYLDITEYISERLSSADDDETADDETEETETDTTDSDTST